MATSVTPMLVARTLPALPVPVWFLCLTVPEPVPVLVPVPVDCSVPVPGWRALAAGVFSHPLRPPQAQGNRPEWGPVRPCLILSKPSTCLCTDSGVDSSLPIQVSKCKVTPSQDGSSFCSSESVISIWNLQHGPGRAIPGWMGWFQCLHGTALAIQPNILRPWAVVI